MEEEYSGSFFRLVILSILILILAIGIYPEGMEFNTESDRFNPIMSFALAVSSLILGLAIIGNGLLFGFDEYIHKFPVIFCMLLSILFFVVSLAN